jgi:phosphopantothenoylcysteine decarboxylase
MRSKGDSVITHRGARHSDMAARDTQGRPNVLLGITGSVAAIKAKHLYDGLTARYNVRVVATESAMKFIKTIEDFDTAVLFRDQDEWDSWERIGDTVLHIELRKWASVFVIAPLSANTMAKMANGICDNLLTSVVRAWDYTRPLVLAPAMNTYMWHNPLTQKHLDACLSLMGGSGVVVPPISKELACGDVGLGAMAEPATILEQVDAVAFPVL